MRRFIVETVIMAAAFYILTKALPQYVHYDGQLVGILVIAAIFGIVNGSIGRIVKLVAMPITFLTMGLVGFLINGGLLLLTAVIADTAGFDLTVGGFPPTFGIDAIVGAIVGAVVLSFLGTVIRLAVPA